jgi:8-oxo-dGTP pyrophosphatase MutT (NUDIX family)
MTLASARDAIVAPLASAAAHIGPRTWAFAGQHAGAIDAHWRRRCRAQPKLFNGDVLLLDTWSLAGGHFCGSCVKSDFKSYLYWREHGAPDATVRDLCVTAALHSQEGWLILGRSAPDMSNAGAVYPFCGTLHPDDDTGGGIDLEGAMLREVEEETGLVLARGDLGPLLLVDTPPKLSLMRPITVPRPAQALVGDIDRFLQASAAPELSGTVIVKGVQDIDAAQMPPFVKAYIEHAFG